MRKLLHNKKGQLDMLTPAILVLVLASIILVFGIVILQELRDTDIIVDAATNSTGDLVGSEVYNAANSTIVGLGTFADFWEIIVLAIVITVVIGLLLVVFAQKRVQ